MIPRPPLDHGLPALSMALDAGAMAAAVRLHVPAVREGELELVNCRPVYIRYKPGTSCLVQYELRLRPTDGSDERPRGRKVQAHARFGRPERIAAIWARPSFGRLIERAARHDRRAPRPHAVSMPELDTIMQFFPLDRELPGLVRVASRRTAGRLLGQALDGTDAGPIRVRRVELVRYKPGRKALLRYLADEAAVGVLYTKIYADSRALTVRDLGLRLGAAGIATPEPLVLLERMGAIVHREAPGIRLATLEGDALRSALPPTGRALARLHGVALPDGLPPALPAAGQLDVAARTVSRLRPDLASRIDRLVAGLGPALAAAEDPTGLIHGDFYDDQVLVRDDGEVVLLDLDEARRGDPRTDVGNALAHLSARAPDALAAEGLRDAFLEGYAGGRTMDPRTTTLFEAAALLGMAVGPFRRLQSDWPEALERLVDLAVQRAEAARVAPSGSPAGPLRTEAVLVDGHVDAALPQLERLLEAGTMRSRLAAVMGRPVEGLDITVARHKPGRRCVVRYDVRLSANGVAASEVRLYGKTYASARGPRVHATLEAFAAVAGGAGLPRLARPVAYLTDLGLQLQTEVRGLSVVPSLLGGDREIAERLAEAVHALHTSGAHLARRHTLADELRPLPGRVDRLAGAAPDLEAMARACLAVLERSAGMGWTWRESSIHRDLYHDQILVGGQGLAFLDLDDAALGEPAVDIANLLAHLRLLSLQDGGADRTLADVARAFRDRSHALDPDLDAGLVQLLEGATLLRLADIHQPREEGARIAAALLAHSSDLLGVGAGVGRS